MRGDTLVRTPATPPPGGDVACRASSAAVSRGCHARQVALAWLLGQYRQIAPIPRTRRRERLEENAAATQVALSADEIADLNASAARISVHGNRYNDQHMSLVGR